jgi:hypothetical protein
MHHFDIAKVQFVGDQVMAMALEWVFLAAHDGYSLLRSHLHETPQASPEGIGLSNCRVVNQVQVIRLPLRNCLCLVKLWFLGPAPEELPGKKVFDAVGAEKMLKLRAIEMGQILAERGAAYIHQGINRELLQEAQKGVWGEVAVTDGIDAVWRIHANESSWVWSLAPGFRVLSERTELDGY